MAVPACQLRLNDVNAAGELPPFDIARTVIRLRHSACSRRMFNLLGAWNAETHYCGGPRLSLEASARCRDKAPPVLSRVKVGAQAHVFVLLQSNRLSRFDRYFDRADRAPVVVSGHSLIADTTAKRQ